MFKGIFAFFSVRREIVALKKRIEALEQSAVSDIDELAARLSAKVMAGMRKEIAKAKKPRSR